MNTCSQLKSLTQNSATLSAMEVLQWAGVIEKAQANPVNDNESFEASPLLLQVALDDLIAMRETEGGRLLEMIKSRGESIVKSVKERRVEVVKALRDEKVMNKISELYLNIVESRLEQELDRLGAHIEEVNAVLKREESIGRRLDIFNVRAKPRGKYTRIKI